MCKLCFWSKLFCKQNDLQIKMIFLTMWSFEQNYLLCKLIFWAKWSFEQTDLLSKLTSRLKWSFEQCDLLSKVVRRQAFCGIRRIEYSLLSMLRSCAFGKCHYVGSDAKRDVSRLALCPLWSAICTCVWLLWVLLLVL